MKLKDWLPPAFSNMFAGSTTRVEPEGRGFFYMLQGDRRDFPYKTLFETYRRIPNLRAVIDIKAAMFSNVKFKLEKTDKENEIDYDHPLNELLSNPNTFQTWRQMLYMISIYKSIAGVSYVYPGFGISTALRHLAFLKPIDFADYYLDKVANANPVTATDIDELVRQIHFYFDNSQVLKFKMSDLLVIKDSFSSYTDNVSRITTLQQNVENIWKCLTARGELIDKKGGVGILSGNQKDGGVQVPMKPDEKKKIEERLNKYGIGKGKEPVIVTDVPLKWQHMIYPTKDLMLFEEIIDDHEAICDGFGIAREIFMNNTTYANKLEAYKGTYSNTLMPEWSDLFDMLNGRLGLAKEKRKLVIDVCHIPVLAENEKDQVELESAKSSMHLAEVQAGVIDIETYKQLMGYDTKTS